MKFRKKPHDGQSSQVQVHPAVHQLLDAKAELAAFKERVEREYARHFPAPITADIWELRLGNRAELLQVYCKECRRVWPCPEWHAYRRVFGWDAHEYVLRLDRKADQ